MVVVTVFVRGAFCDCHRRAIIKWMLCHGGSGIDGEVVGMVVIVRYLGDGGIVVVVMV
jgi:hypothetical protein